MRLEQEKRQLARIEGRHSRKSREWRSLIGRKCLPVFNDMAT